MSTFGSFSTVRLGIYAAQKGLDVTGNNIANINTNGYTRQRLNQVSLITSASDRYYSIYKTRIGQGAVIQGVDQLRDPGLDISYRKANSDLGSVNAKLDGLDSLASILDEVGKGDGEQDDGVLLNQLNDMRDLINKTLTTGMNDTQDGLIRSSADALTTLFNTAAGKLEELNETYTTNFNDQVDTVNNILNAIRDLNVSIRNADIRGDAALELRDQRNLLMDELSQYVKFDAKYTMENIGAGVEVERLTITLATGDKNTLVDGEYGTQFTQKQLAENPAYDPLQPAGPTNPPYLDEEGNPTDDETLAAKVYNLELEPLTDAKGKQQDPAAVAQPLGDDDLYGALQSTREILTEKGEYDTPATTKRGIPYYQKALDSLANEFAVQMNALNNPTTPPNTPLPGEGDLFSASDGAATITASNISISQEWKDGTVSMLATTDPNASSGDTSNLAKFLDAFSKKFDYTPSDVSVGSSNTPYYTGSFEDMLLHIQSTLAEDQMTTTAVSNNYAVTLDEVYVSRDSVTGVDLNDEATSLMTYQKAYSAACRLMTTLNDALDSLLAMG